jgi:molecular chaperone GrpE
MKHAPRPEPPAGDGLKSAAEIALERAAQAPKGKAQGDAVSLPRDEHDRLRADAAKAADHWDRLLRAQAEMENYRKRMAREKQDWIKSANEKLLAALLTPLDHFEMGLQAARQSSSFAALQEGMELVHAQFRGALQANGVTEIEAVGKPFDPAQHEAVAHQESDAPEGQVIQQLRKGYRLADRVLRAASVIVSKGPAAGAPAAPPPANGPKDEAQEI